MQQNGIHYSENGGVRADSQRQRQNRDGAETGAFAQHARAIPNVLPEVFHFRTPTSDQLFEASSSRFTQAEGTRVVSVKSHKSAKTHRNFRRLAVRPGRSIACRGTLFTHEFQAILVSCFLRASHSVPTRTRGATSIKRGM